MEQVNSNTEPKKWKQLTERDRYKIEGYFNAGMKPSEIAPLIGCSKRTIERERNLGTVELVPSVRSPKKDDPPYPTVRVYAADVAQRRNEENEAAKGRNLKIGNDHRLAAFMEEKIGVEKWSPDAVIGHIKEKGLEFDTTICTKTAYNYIDRGLFLNISNKDLPRKKKPAKRKRGKAGAVALNNRNGRSIEERPEEAESRTEKGHWEIDLVVGKQGTKPVVLTLVERKSRKSIYVKAENKTKDKVLEAIKKAAKRLHEDFGDVMKTITADNGSEFLDGEGIKAATGCGEVYYAHPYSSWERGSNENGNRMLRRFVPKGTDLAGLTEEELLRIERWVNSYPRRLLGYKTADEAYSAA